MIKKQNIWFLTLFSLILVLSIYYVTIPNQLLLSDNGLNIPVNSNKNNENVQANIEEGNLLDTLQVSLDEERYVQITDLQLVLNNVDSTMEEKNSAYEQLKNINVVKAEEEKLEKKIMDMYKLESFIKIQNSEIRVTIINTEHTSKLANDIMRCIQEEYKNKMYISIKFE